MVKRTEVAKTSTPSQKEIDAAVEQSAERLEQQAEPPTDVHPKPTTPSKAEVEAAVEQSAEYLESQGVTTDTATSDASPVSSGGTNAPASAQPAYGGRDRSQDAQPVFQSPIPDKPRQE